MSCTKLHETDKTRVNRVQAIDDNSCICYKTTHDQYRQAMIDMTWALTAFVGQSCSVQGKDIVLVSGFLKNLADLRKFITSADLL